MTKRRLFANLMGSLLLLAACQSTQQLPAVPQTDEAVYQNAIATAMSPEPDKISDQLIPIRRDNSNLVWKSFDGEDYVLTVSWKNEDKWYRPYLDSAFYNTGNYPIWISTAPELWERMRGVAQENADRRLIQLLGLPPNATYTYFVEFWVRPADLFRPCPDGDITDEACQLYFPAGTDSAHIDYINKNRISRYYQEELYSKYPWTQLGYTYDWDPANPTHVGLSEFVIGLNKNIKIKAIYTTEEYLNKTSARN